MYMGLTFVKLQNAVVSTHTHHNFQEPQVLESCHDRRGPLTFPKVMLAATQSARKISSVGDQRTELSTASLSNLKVTHCLTCGICEAPLHRLVESAGSSRRMFDAM